ncbi:thiamine phosphate synthase [Lentibacillus sp. N15]|uniref:thiamine phosphate synthase n=1 Tax=Lentibacillus songyuanensis TaxID=3136161 RepID=UPI0031BB5140
MSIPFQRQQLRKYFIMGTPNCRGKDPVTLLKAALDAGITAFQFREKGKGSLTGNKKLTLGLTFRHLCLDYNVPFIVNDDIELAKSLDADWIHVGQDDQPVERVREQFPDKIIGLSVSNNHEVQSSPISFVDYVGAGPIFQTTSKENAKEPVGLPWIQTLSKKFPNLPIVGIGGITTENAASVIDSGADGVSVISAITQAENIKEAVMGL